MWKSASAATVAALSKMAEKGIPIQQTVVCVLTGDGLKDANVILKAAITPPTIYPNENEFLALYESHFFNGKSMIFSDKNFILFDTVPTVERIQEQLFHLLNTNYADEYVSKIQTILTRILKKGKSITVSDFQDSVQDALQAVRHPSKNIFSVVDFNVTTGKDCSSTAQVKITIAGEEHCAEGAGVGPVDAVINALQYACKEQIDFTLTDYKVDIRSQGVDAVVHVESKLLKDRFYSLGRGTSPDIIQASIEAFEEAYNGFC